MWKNGELHIKKISAGGFKQTISLIPPTDILTSQLSGVPIVELIFYRRLVGIVWLEDSIILADAPLWIIFQDGIIDRQ